MLELAILGLLKERPMHGYDLRKRLRSESGLLTSLSFGSLYPALVRLEAAGAVRELPKGQLGEPNHDSPVPLVPPSGSLTGERAAFRARLATRAVSAASAARETRVGGRSRKVYELTATGEELFAKLLADVVPARDGERGFSLRWAFARHLAPESRLELLERRRRHLEARLEGAKRAVSRPPRPLDRFEGSLAEHSCEVVRAERDWIDKLIATEHALLDRQSDDGALSSARSH